MRIEKVECIPMVYPMDRPIYSGTGRCDARQLLLAAFHLDMVHFLMNRMQELEENRHNQIWL